MNYQTIWQISQEQFFMLSLTKKQFFACNVILGLKIFKKIADICSGPEHDEYKNSKATRITPAF